MCDNIKTLSLFWRAAYGYGGKASDIADDINLPRACDELRENIEKELNRRLPLKIAATLVKGAARVLQMQADLTLQEKISSEEDTEGPTHTYLSRAEFIREYELLVEECRAYVEPNSQFTRQAEAMQKVTEESLSAHTYLSRAEFIREYELLVEECRAYVEPNSQFTRQAEAMQKVTEESLSAHTYLSRAEFIREYELLVEECRAYVEPNSQFTRQAEAMQKVTEESLSLEQSSEHVAQLEANIAKVQAKMLEEAEYEATPSEEDAQET